MDLYVYNIYYNDGYNIILFVTRFAEILLIAREEFESRMSSLTEHHHVNMITI